jgi:VanZ family protein
MLKSLIRAVAWLTLACIIFLSLGPPEVRPNTPLPHILEHAGIFVAAGIAFAAGYPLREWLLTAGAVFFCAGLEFAQLAVPGRHARLSDFIVDAVAALAGLLVASIGIRRFFLDDWHVLKCEARPDEPKVM